MYKTGKEALLGGDVDFVNSTISAALINLSEYAPDTLNDETLADIPEDAIVSEVLLTGKSIIDSSTPGNVAFDADDAVFQSVAPSGIEVGAVVLFLDHENIEDTRLLILIDDAPELPVETAGRDITVTFGSGGILDI